MKLPILSINQITKAYVFLIFFSIISLSSFGQSPVIHKDNGTVILENFESDPIGGLPHHWYDRDGNKKLINHSKDFTENYLYEIKSSNGDKYLSFEGKAARHISLPLTNKDRENIYNIDIYETPILSWKVRAHKLPENANERDNDRNDSVASIYVVFGMGRVALFKQVPKSIRYTWSTTMEEGDTSSKLFGNQQIVVVKSGSKETGKWITFERNILEDYRRLFGDDPPHTPLAILILSDGDSTGSFVKADYDDLMLKPAK